MAGEDSYNYEARKAFWRRVNSNRFNYNHVSDLEPLLDGLSSDEISGQLEKFASHYTREKLGSRILENVASSDNKRISERCRKNLGSVLSALNNYNEPAISYLATDDKLDAVLAIDPDERQAKNLIGFLSNPEMVRCVNKLAREDSLYRNCFALSYYLDFSDEKTVSTYTNFILALDAFADRDDDGVDMLSDINDKTYRLFGPDKSAGIFGYLAKRRDKTAIRKIKTLEDNGSEGDNKIRNALDKIDLQNFGVKKAERLINLAYFLGIAEMHDIEVRQETDLNAAYDTTLEAIKRHFSRKYAIKDQTKIERLSYWLREFDAQTASIFAGKKIYKKGRGRSYVLSKRDDVVLCLKPSDLETQMEALQNITSCLSPGGDFFKHTRDYLKNPYVFWGVIKANGKVVGRMTISICKKAINSYAIPKISADYSLCRISEIRSDVKVSERKVDSALRKYAKESGMNFIKTGDIFVEKLDDIYDDYVYTDREYNGGVIANLNNQT